jgi:hypothetical protein
MTSRKPGGRFPGKLIVEAEELLLLAGKTALFDVTECSCFKLRKVFNVDLQAGFTSRLHISKYSTNNSLGNYRYNSSKVVFQLFCSVPVADQDFAFKNALRINITQDYVWRTRNPLINKPSQQTLIM